jgi:hypothetical protein
MTKLKAQITNEFQNPNFKMFVLSAVQFQHLTFIGHLDFVI